VLHVSIKSVCYNYFVFLIAYKRLIELLVKVEDYANPRKAEEREAQGRREEKARADAQLKAKDAEIERLKRAAERGGSTEIFF
jgi:hypothetical protein